MTEYKNIYKSMIGGIKIENNREHTSGNTGAVF